MGTISKGNEVKEYTVVIRGDATGDGKVNSADLLRIVKYLKEEATINMTAGDATEDDKVNSADLLRIVKYLKEEAEINF